MPANSDFKNVREYTVHKRHQEILSAIDDTDTCFADLMNSLAELFDLLYLNDSRDRKIMEMTDTIGPLHNMLGEIFSVELEEMKNSDEADRTTVAFNDVFMNLMHTIEKAQGK